MDSSSTTPRFRIGLLLLAIGLPLVVGAGARCVGIRHGEPNVIWHPDVAKQVWVARKLNAHGLELRALYKDDVELTLYPYGSAVLASHAVTLVEAATGETYAMRNNWAWALVLRRLSSGMMLAAMAIALLAIYRECGPGGTLLAGLLLALEPLNAQLSHYGMNDVPMASLALVAWLAASRIPNEPARWPWASLLAGLLIGLGFGIKYQTILCGVFVLVAWAQAWQAKGWAGTLLSAVACGTAALAGILVTTPMLTQNPAYFFQSFPEFMAWQAHITGVKLPFAEKVLRNGASLASWIAKDGRWLLLPMAGYAVVLAVRNQASATVKNLALSGVAFAGLLLLALLLSRDYVRANDMIPLLPILVILSAFGLAAVTDPLARSVARMAAVVAAVWFGGVSVQDSLALARPDTRLLARDWCLEHVTAGSVVRRERYIFPVEKEGVINRSHRNFAEPEPSRIVQEGHDDYLIVCSLASERVFDKRLPHYSESGHAVYAWLRDNYDVAAVFRDRPLLHAHPEIVIYRKRPPTSDQEGTSP